MHVVVPDASVIRKWALPSGDEPNADRALLLRNAIRDDLVRAVVNLRDWMPPRAPEPKRRS